MITESNVELYLVNKINAIGGLAMKFTSPGLSGVPDRLILYRGFAFFVELKKPHGKPRELQKKMAKRIRSRGTKVFCISTKEQVDELAVMLESGIEPMEQHFDRI